MRFYCIYNVTYFMNLKMHYAYVLYNVPFLQLSQQNKKLVTTRAQRYNSDENKMLFTSLQVRVLTN